MVNTVTKHLLFESFVTVRIMRTKKSSKVLLCLTLSIVLVLLMASAFPVYAYKITTEPELSLQVGDVDYITVWGLSGTGWTECKSSNPAVAQVTEDSSNSSSFRVEAQGAGAAIITITATDQGTGERATAKCTITVTGAAPAPKTPAPPATEAPPTAQEPAAKKAIPVESITIEPKLFFLKIGGERQLNVKIKPPGANAADVIVKSYDSNVIDIYDNAVVKGLNVGYSEIVAATRDGKVTATSRVFVGDEKEVVGLVLGNIWSKTKEFLAGESFQVKTPTATCGVRG